MEINSNLVNKFLNQRRNIINRVKALSDCAVKVQGEIADENVLAEFKIRYGVLGELINAFDSLHLEIMSCIDNEVELIEQDRIQSEFDNLQYSIQVIYQRVFNEKKSISPCVSPVLSRRSENKKDEIGLQGDNVSSVKKSVSSIKLDNNVKAQSNHGSSVNSDKSCDKQRSTKGSNIKLGRIQIPKFNGNVDSWPTFYDLFDSLVHANKDYLEIEKFQFLIASLTGDALSVVKNLPLTKKNYLIAYDKLVKRYKNDRVLMTHYWQALAHAPRCEGDSKLSKLLDTFSENLAALDQYQYNLWDFTKFNLILGKLDSETKHLFERLFSDSEVPTYSQLFSFLEKQSRADELASLTNKSKPFVKRNFSYTKDNFKGSKRINSFVTKSCENKPGDLNCVLCHSGHTLEKCAKFLGMSPSERNEFVKNARLCFQCLSSSHMCMNCDSGVLCRNCNRKHHHLLHYTRVMTSGGSSGTSGGSSGTSGGSSRTSGGSRGLGGGPSGTGGGPSGTGGGPSGTSGGSCGTGGGSKRDSGGSSEICDRVTLGVYNTLVSEKKTVLLSTALVCMKDVNGQLHKCRALVDSASQASFVTDSFAKVLGLPRSNKAVQICGVNQMKTSNLGTVTSRVYGCQESKVFFETELVVVKNICGVAPSVNIQQEWEHLKGLQLADLEYGQPMKVQMLLGADVFGFILREGVKIGKTGTPSAINTVFGWVLLGSVGERGYDVTESFCTLIDTSLDSAVKRFWEVEEVPSCKKLSEEDQACEDIFVKTCHRDKNGRYVVSLPFRETSAELGESRSQALRRFYNLEAKLCRSAELYQQYSEFMRDYVDQGHMSLSRSGNSEWSKVYYIPHHCVLRPESSSTKLRVVYDASAKSSTGVSLNDKLFIGPVLQRDIVSILLTFRIHKVVFTADIRQMYRQILVLDSHRDFQRILWRFSVSDDVSEYLLNTVTYGVSSSPYLAIRTLLQLAVDEGQNYPAAATILQRDTYVDDVASGADSVEEALHLQTELIMLLSKGCFELRKWASNCEEVVASVPRLHQQCFNFSDKDQSNLKILGLQWNPKGDCFSYDVKTCDQLATKRGVLSEVARIYDPIGFLAPLTLLAKYIIQCTWKLGLGWDDILPEDLRDKWEKFKGELCYLSDVKISRKIVFDDVAALEWHGFCDASQIGYGAVVYLKQVTSTGRVYVSLVCAKSKVCPLKVISIPRLELCAAVLLADLLEFVQHTYKERFANFPNPSVQAWTDSKVVLAWIKSSPSRWKTFVANRVSQLQEKVEPRNWYHVSGSDNPADCVSRGLYPQELVNHVLWWSGPQWLSLNKGGQGIVKHVFAGVEEEMLIEERKLVCVIEIPDNVVINLLNKFSSVRRIQRILVYVKRFMNSRLFKSPCVKGTPGEAELYDAMILLVKTVQQITFQEEISKLKGGHMCSKPMRKLALFFDDQGVLRVGGRLRHSELPFDAKHPMLLPRRHRLTELIIQYFHHRYMHPGLKSLHYLIVQQFWILSARRAINHVLSQCNQCFRTKPSSQSPSMGDLPSFRVSQVKPFVHCGVDFAGPFKIVLSRYRGVRAVKSYVCLFVCCATKALHLEVVSDLTAEAFLGALRRFVARRGRCSNVYSDNGTNFVGAHNLLKSYANLCEQELSLKWHFNPPASPHFGGLWEAGVKSVKTHLDRVVGNQVLTLEEFQTLLAQIEAILNSRPLCSVSPDPNDLTVLCPSHFLTFESMCAPPDPDVTVLPINRLSRWQLVQRCVQDFWKRWHIEYLHTLQQRHKWNSASEAVDVGTLVLVRDDNVKPLQWSLARVMKLYPGKDGVCRVAQIKTPTGFLTRPVIRLCPLPSQ